MAEYAPTSSQAVTTRTTPPSPLDAEAQAAFLARAQALAPLYRAELLLPRGAAASSDA